ncbi:MAG TPA: hypothetical protein VFF73_02725 [Planctomycetota bacterium]|nr:hypothetical protein [Planctomycetota bacterium]
MDCEEFARWIDDEPNLDAAKKVACYEHALRCEKCRKVRNGLRAYEEAAASPTSEQKNRMFDNIMAKVAEPAAPPAPAKDAPEPVGLPGWPVIAIVFALGFGGGYLVRWATTRTDEPARPRQEGPELGPGPKGK